MQPITLHHAPYHVVQYRESSHVYGCLFTTRATTTKGIAKAAARAAREDIHYWTNDPRRAPVVTMIDFVALIPRDWHDVEMQQFTDMVDREASKPRTPKMHESAEHPTAYTDNYLCR